MSDAEATVDAAFLGLTVGREQVNRYPKRQGDKLAQCLSCHKRSERVQLARPGRQEHCPPRWDGRGRSVCWTDGEADT